MEKRIDKETPSESEKFFRGLFTKTSARFDASVVRHVRYSSLVRRLFQNYSQVETLARGCRDS
jgi:hypothetical protein